MRIIGLDPGGTTGVAVLHIGPSRGELFPDEYLELTDIADVLGAVVRTARGSGVIVAYERFVVSRRAGRSKTAGASQKARDIIGAVEVLCQSAGVTRVKYNASQVKRWATNKRLEAAGLMAPTRGKTHARDAARHALHAARWHAELPDPLGAAWRESYRFDLSRED